MCLYKGGFLRCLSSCMLLLRPGNTLKDHLLPCNSTLNLGGLFSSVVGIPHRSEANRSILLCAWSIAILYLGNWVLSPITELKSLLWEASSNKEREDSIYFQYCGFRETLKGFFLCGAIVSALVVVTHFC